MIEQGFRQRVMDQYAHLIPVTIMRGSAAVDFFISIMRGYFKYVFTDEAWDAELLRYHVSEFDPSFSFLDFIVAERETVAFLQKCKPFNEIIDRLATENAQLKYKIRNAAENLV